MVRRQQPAQATPRPLGRRRSRQQQEQRRIRILLAVGIVGLVLILVIPAVGYYISFVGPPREVVVKVNDTKYTLGDLVKILRSYQYSAGSSGLDLSRVPFDVVNLLMENEIIRQFSPQLSITVTDEEITADIRKTILADKKEGDTTPQEQLDREFSERYRNLLNGTKLSETDHRALVQASLLRDKVRERLSQEVASVAPQYHLYALTVQNEALAKEVKLEFERGVEFKDLVSKYSTDSEVVRKEGEIGWIPEGIYSELDTLAKSLETGKISEPRNEVVAGAPGQAGKVQYTIYFIKKREPARNLDDDQKKLFKEQALQKWVAEQRAKSVVETKFGSEEYTWVVQQLRKSTPVQPGQQPQKQAAPSSG
jgi:hypothetical protein